MTFKLLELLRLFTAIRLEDPELWERIREFARKHARGSLQLPVGTAAATAAPEVRRSRP